jgi:hypothetical protein
MRAENDKVRTTYEDDKVKWEACKREFQREKGSYECEIRVSFIWVQLHFIL